MQWQKINRNFNNLKISRGQAQIWFFEVDKFEDEAALFKSILSADELLRAEKFKFESDKNHLILARGILRFLIHIQTGLKPGSIEFQNNSYGKPELKKEQNNKSLRFSVSHSSNSLCIGMAPGVNIGVDIESIKSIPDLKELAEKYFSESEFRQISSLSGSELLEAFYNCWTRKEATIKALGIGLSFPLKEFDVSLLPGEEPRIIGVRGTADNQLKLLRLDTFKIGNSFIGAAALNNKIENINYFWVDRSNQLISELKLILK